MTKNQGKCFGFVNFIIMTEIIFPLLTCAECGKQMREITNTHLKKHSLTVKQYKEKYPEELSKNPASNKLRGDFSKGKTYEERYGKKTAKAMREIRKIKTSLQMKNSKQIAVRKEKCALYRNPAERNRKISEAAKRPETIEKRHKTMLKKYGTTNTLLISGRFSQMAYDYIIKYIKENNIPDEQCYYQNKKKTRKEYYQMIFDPISQKNRFVYYDLVVFNKEKTEIDLILEFNGPFHYRKKDVLLDPLGPATPMKNNSLTKQKAHETDILKLNHAKVKAKQVLVYWNDTRSLEEYIEDKY